MNGKPDRLGGGYHLCTHCGEYFTYTASRGQPSRLVGRSVRVCQDCFAHSEDDVLHGLSAREARAAHAAAKAIRTMQAWQTNTRGLLYELKPPKPKTGDAIVSERIKDERRRRLVCGAAISIARMRGWIEPNMYQRAGAA